MESSDERTEESDGAGLSANPRECLPRSGYGLPLDGFAFRCKLRTPGARDHCALALQVGAG